VVAARRIIGICLLTLSLSLTLSLGLVGVPPQGGTAYAEGGDSYAGGGTAYVDGISDQSVPTWDGNFSGSYFAALFHEAWVGNPPSHITLARYVVQWNASAESEEGKPAYLGRFESWLRDVSSIGLVPDLALTSYTGSYPSSAGEYQAQLQQILALAQAMGHPIRYLEAWNEPNNQGNVSASTAAQFTNSASAICKEDYRCTVIAGNFEDSQNVARYEEEYLKIITTTPIIWGVHPYYSVEEMSETPFLNFLDHLPDKGIGQQIWFTEISARKCSDFDGHQVENGELGQAQRANWLVNILMKNARPEHVFYYELLLKERRQPSCITEAWDGALYLPGKDPGEPDYPRLAASYIWGGTGGSRAYIDGAFMTNAAQRTLTGAAAP
jgi:hypothetical protein